MMKITERGINLIKQFESFRNNAYLDSAGVPTIGYGNTYYADGTKVKLGDNITIKKGEKLFNQILKSYVDGVNELVQVPINHEQFDSLVSFAYNCGVEALKDSTLLKKVNDDPYDPQIKKEFLKWVNSGGRKVNGLVRRRKQEAFLYFS